MTGEFCSLMLILQGGPERERAHTSPISSQHTASCICPLFQSSAHPRVAILRVGAQQCGLQSQTKVKSAGGGEGTPHGLAVRGGTLRWQPTSQSQSRDPDSSQQDWVPDGAMIPTEQYVPVSPSRRTPKEPNPTHRSPYHKQLSPGRPSLRVG